MPSKKELRLLGYNMFLINDKWQEEELDLTQTSQALL